MIMRFLLIIFAVFVGSFFFASSVFADCTLSNPYWPSGSKRIGEVVTVSVRADGCSSEGTVQIRIYDNDPLPDPDDLVRSISLPTRNGILTSSTVITSNDWQAAGGVADGDLELYFEAKSCVSAVCTNTVTSGEITIVPESLPSEVTLLPTPPAGGGQTGRPISFNFSFDNPLGPDGPQNLLGLIEAVARWIMALAIPIAVIMIIYGGILFLTAGQKPDNVKKGKDILKYAIIGLAIVLIGNGFVSLVRSVIELGGSSSTPTPLSQPQSPSGSNPTPTPRLGGLGAACASDSQCQSGLVCDSRNECHAPITNKKPSGAPCTIDDECLSDRCDSNSGQINVCF